MHATPKRPQIVRLLEGVNPFASRERLRADEVLQQLSLVPGALDSSELRALQDEVDAAGGHNWIQLGNIYIYTVYYYSYNTIKYV